MTTSLNAAGRRMALQDRLAGLPVQDFLDNFVIYHAAPTIRGLKPSTLACPNRTDPGLAEAFPVTARRLSRHFGLSLLPLRNRSGGLMVFAYNRGLLSRVLAEPASRTLLRGAGFSDPGRLDSVLAELRGRFDGEAFPHEIGVLLGYPADDVARFIHDGGKGATITGDWRAYGDEVTARRAFERNRAARALAANLILSGSSLPEMAARLIHRQE
ncbi:MAG: DUF3793 family protein [Planctomycetes bacterium]|nr:DUF3793 family protein [Planctomycetota bacterium]